MSKLTLEDVLALAEKMDECTAKLLDTDLTSERYAERIGASKSTADRRLKSIHAKHPGTFDVLKIGKVIAYRLTESGRKLMEEK